MQKENEVIDHRLYDQVNKLNLIDDTITLNKDFILGFILKDANTIKPQLINDLNSVIELLIDIKDCQVINKNIFFEFIVVFAHVCQNLHKHKIHSLMQFYQQSIDQVTNDPLYLKNTYLKHERHDGKNAKNINEFKSKMQEKKHKIQDEKYKIEEPKPKIEEQKPNFKVSQIRMASLVRSKSQLGQCPICLVEINLQNISILACGHIYHKQCFEQCMKESILNKRFPLKCPAEQCTQNIETGDIEEYLTKELVDKYYEFTLHNFVDKNSQNMSWCPTPGCANAFELDQGISLLSCIKCGKNYCMNCKTQFHIDKTCEQNREMMNLSQDDKEFLNFVKGAKYKQCPKCKFWVSKSEGCCHMTCRCTYEFCYVCGGKHGDCNCQEVYEGYYGSPADSGDEDDGMGDSDSDEIESSDDQNRDRVNSV